LSFTVSGIIGIHEDHDMALLRVEQASGTEPLPEPLPIAKAAPASLEGRQVYVIGYPAWDGRRNDPEPMKRIFAEIYNVKRLQPGEVSGVALAQAQIFHDCSTLGGNSGSVVLDLESGQAIALHFSGRFLVANYAVSARTVADALRGVREGSPRPPASRGPDSRPSRPIASRADAAVDATSTGLTIPLRIRIEVGSVQADDSATAVRVVTRRPPTPEPDGDDDQPEDDEVIEEARPEDYAGREGYAADFLGTDVPLPDVRDEGDVLTFRFDGRAERELKYEHFSVVMSRRRRLCLFSAVNIDGGRSRKVKRPRWRRDPRIEAEAQIEHECYGTEPRFSRGHMTRREDPIWGSPQVAARGNSDSMHVTNAVPQMQPFNAGIWLGLEDYALENARQDDMKISVITGPVLGEDDPFRFGVQIPTTFWKVIAFIHDETGEPCVTGYTMAQDDFLREEEFVFGRHETAQVPLSVIESMAGMSFPDELRRLDPLERVHEARPRPLRDFRQIRFR
jgi:endonuclease G, mitochondrial